MRRLRPRPSEARGVEGGKLTRDWGEREMEERECVMK